MDKSGNGTLLTPGNTRCAVVVLRWRGMMNAIRSARPRAPRVTSVARLATNSKGRKIVRDPRKAKQRPRASTALEEVREEERAPAPPYQPFLQQNNAPQSLGSSMMQSMTWGVGMALAFTAVGLFFR